MRDFAALSEIVNELELVKLLVLFMRAIGYTRRRALNMGIIH